MTKDFKVELAKRMNDKEHRILNIIVRQLDLLEDISATIHRSPIEEENLDS